MRFVPYLKAVSVVALAAVAAGACDDGLVDLNNNPNNPNRVPANLLFPSAVQSAVGRANGSTLYWDYSGSWVQHLAKIQYTNEDRYQLRTAANDAHWQGFYRDGLQDLSVVIAQADSASEPRWKASAMVMRSWIFGVVTDVWGDVPYTDAVKGLTSLQGAGSEVTSPKYDPQETVYRGILSELRQAGTLATQTGGNFGNADLIYGGDAQRWQKFANSLRLRYAMRMADRLPDFARSEFAAALAAQGGVFTGNADNAMLRYVASRPNNNPLNELFRTRYDHAVSKTLVDTLKAMGDPRLMVYAAPNAAGEYRGAPNGVISPGVPFDSISAIGEYFMAPDAPSMLMSYSEVLLLQAEAAARGWTNGNASELYNQAIRASLSYYNVPDAQITAYLAHPRAQYNGLPSIHLQKWIALFGNGVEAWSEWRRTGVPVLTPGPRAANSRRIPARFPYPSIEQSVNNTNRLEAITRQNPGRTTITLNELVWWDVARNTNQ